MHPLELMTRTRRRTGVSTASVLVTAALAACDSTQLTNSAADRIIPQVTVSVQVLRSPGSTVDSVNVRSPLRITVNASDNAALSTVVTRVFVDNSALAKDSAVFTVSSTTYQKTLSIPLAGVLPGQRVSVRTTVVDGGGNSGVAQVDAVAFDPSVPRVRLTNPDAAVIPGGTYNFVVQADDTLGIAKVGYRVTGLPGVNRADSILRSVPLPRNDSVTFSVQVPSSTTVGASFTVEPFAENRDGLRANGASFTVRVIAAGPDVQAPLVFQTVPPRLETNDLIDLSARDPDGLVRILGYIAKDSAGRTVFSAADTIAQPAQQVARRKAFTAPIALRGRGLFIIGYAVDASGKTGYAVPTGATIPISADSLAKRDAVVYAFGQTMGLPTGSLGADIAVDTTRNTVYVSNINKNQLEVFGYSAVLAPRPSVAVGSQPWGMIIDNSGSILLVANSGGTNISQVDLGSRVETGRVKTTNEYLFDIQYSKDDASGGFKYKVVGPIDYSDRPQYVAQAASGALYYSTRPTSEARPGTLRRLDNFLDARAEPRQIWQYGSESRGHYVVLNADAVDVVEGQQGIPDEIIICDHPQGQQPSSGGCAQDKFVPNAIAQLQASGSNAVAVKDLDVASLALPDTNFVAVGGDRRRVAFGEANTGNRAGRVLLVFDSSGTAAGSEDYSAPIEVKDLTNNASDRVFGLAINGNSQSVAVHGVETFFADSALRLQGKFATFNTGAGIAFHPRNMDENTADQLARVVFVASGDKSIQIVDSYSYRLRGRIPLRTNLYGPLRAVLPTPAERASDPSLAVKLFGLTPEGLVVIDVRQRDIDNAASSVKASR
jgi:hypothetical protein